MESSISQRRTDRLFFPLIALLTIRSGVLLSASAVVTRRL
jgi:hypothetical protein